MGFLRRFDLTKRRSSSSRTAVENDVVLKREFANHVATVCDHFNIPGERIFNMDETGVNFDLSGNYMIEHKGRKRVTISKNSKSKQRVTVV